MKSQLRLPGVILGAMFLAISLLATPAGAQIPPLDDRAAALKGADRLLDIQNANGSFPWLLPDTTPYQNVQGVTAIGLLEAYKLSADSRYLDAAKKTRDWLATYRYSTTPPRALSASNIYFLAEYALLSLNLDDLNLARAVLAARVEEHSTGAGLVTFIIQARKDQGHTNLGLWDAALYVRAAQDVGSTALANEMANALATQSIVDPFATTANWYEIGLTGLILGLSEADFLGHKDLIDDASAALLATQAADGSFPSTYGGVVYPQDTQTTAYAVLGLLSVAQIQPALAGADFIRVTQRADGSFAPCLPDDSTGCGGQDYAEVDAEAIAALVAAVLPLPNGVLAYGDAAVAVLPPPALLP